jgi:3-(3-hydroxy-phenyl)propionate hydroxylase
VLVVGAGPVGLAVANFLVAMGVSVVVVERNPSTSEEAKAISLDDESLRAFQAAGLSGEIEQVVVPGTGTRYYDRRDRVLFHARGAGPPYRLGFAFKNQFSQPQLEVVLTEALTRRRVDVRFATELVGLVQADDGVTVRLREVTTGAVTELEFSWVLGCDGGRSTVRQLLGIDMSGTSHQQVWLVVDTLADQHRERYGMHYGNPRRPTVVVPGRDGRCRYEFRLKAEEATPGEPPSAALLAQLLAPFRVLTEEQIERSVVYRFHALVADRWRSARCFLLGDAAHMMPPFAGQGLNSGVRDAANLAWKLAMVWHCEILPDVLDTYELERRPHAMRIVEFSEWLGRVVMTTNRWRAFLRDLAVRAILLLPTGRRYLREMRFRPRARHERGIVFRPDGMGGPLVGSMLPQPWVIAEPTLRRQQLDEVLGSGFVVLGVDVDAEAWDELTSVLGRHPLPRLRGIDVVLDDRLPTADAGRSAIADTDGTLEAMLGSARGRFVLVKPDRYVAAVFPVCEADGVATAMSRWLRAPQPDSRAADFLSGPAAAPAGVRLESF